MNQNHEMPSIALSELIKKLDQPGKIRIDITEFNLYFVPVVYFIPEGLPIEALGVIINGDHFLAARDLHDLKTELQDLIGTNVEINIPDRIPLHPVFH